MGRLEAREGHGSKADKSKVRQQRSSRLPADRPSSELSQESGRSVQHGASSIPPADCLGPVWGGLLTTGPPYLPPATPMHIVTRLSLAVGAAAGFIRALTGDCHINIYSIRF